MEKQETSMEAKFIPVTEEQDIHIDGMWCCLCAYGLCKIEGDCPPCIPHQREDGKRGYYVNKQEVMVTVPMSFLNEALDV